MQTKKKDVNDDAGTGFFAGISLFFYKRQKLSLVILAIIILFGGLSYTTLLRREGFPAVSVPIVVAAGTYFVDDVQKVDAEVVSVISDIALSVEGVESVSTSAGANNYQLVATLSPEVDSEIGTENVKAAIEEANVLPPQANINFIKIDASKFRAEYDVLVSLYSLSANALPQDLQAKAAEIVPIFAESDQISEAVAIDLFDTGINPASGETIVRQSSFGRYGFRDDTGSFTTYPSTVIGIKGVGGESIDIFELSDAINTQIEKIKPQLTDDYGIIASADFTTQVNEQVGSLQDNVLSGLLAVTIVSLLMISWRVSILSVIFMVSVILVTASVLYLSGNTLNTISLFALVLALGLFVDDATIVSEAIDARKNSSKKRTEIIRRAINGIGAASTSGTTTTILVFVPLLFITGILGDFIRIMPITIIISLITSLVLSLTLIPVLSKYTILTDKNLGKKSWHNPLSDVIANMLLLLKTRKFIGLSLGIFMVFLSFGFIGAAGYYSSKLSFNIFPPSKDSDQLGVKVAYQPGTSIETAEDIADEVSQTIEAVIGDNLAGISFGRDSAPSQRSADVLVELTSFRERDIKSPEIITELESAFKQYGRANISVGQFDAGPPADELPFKVQVTSEDPEAANNLADDIATFLSGSQVERTNGTTANIVRTDVASTETITRVDGDQYVQASAAFDADDVSALLLATEQKVKDEFTSEKLETYGLDESALGFDYGQESDNEDSFASLGLAGLVALVAMFVLLAVQFRSLLKPLLIFMALPFSLLGVTLGLLITDNSLSFFSMIGLIGLIGIAVNNTILLTDAANQNRKRGMGIVESIAEASRGRFRPLITTTLTTVAALLPLALADPFWEPLAVTIMGGLISSTILVILAFPYYFILVGLLREFYKGKVLATWVGAFVIVTGLAIVIGGMTLVIIPVYIFGSMVFAVTMLLMDKKRFRAVI